jgi:hypothetical protein
MSAFLVLFTPAEFRLHWHGIGGGEIQVRIQEGL